jgi:hypothetical protein
METLRVREDTIAILYIDKNRVAEKVFDGILDLGFATMVGGTPITLKTKIEACIEAKDL